MHRVPRDAFEQYVAMGTHGTYAALAKRVGVSKRSIVRTAVKQRWQERLAEIEREARKKSDAALVESIEAVNIRHLKTLRTIQARALQGLQSLPLKSGSDCVRALVLALKAERGVIGRAAEGDTWADLMAEAWRRQNTPDRLADGADSGDAGPDVGDDEGFGS